MKTLTAIPPITTTLPATHTDAAALAAQSERCAVIAAHEENAKTMKGALKKRLVLWIVFLFVGLAGTGTFLSLWLKSPDQKKLADLKSAAANAEIAADKARIEAGKANAELLTKDAELTAAKGAATKALADKVNAEKELSDAKAIAKTATDKLAAIEKDKAEANAKAIADAAAAEKAAMLAKLAELARKLEEKAVTPAPQANPAPVVTAEKPVDGVRGGLNPVGWKAAINNFRIAAEARKDQLGHAAFVAALNGTMNADQKAFLTKLASMKPESDPDKGYLMQAIAASGGSVISKTDGRRVATPGQ